MIFFQPRLAISLTEANIDIFKSKLSTGAVQLPREHLKVNQLELTQLAKGRDLLRAGQRGGEVVRVEIPAGGQMLKTNFLTALNWSSSGAILLGTRT